MAATYAIGGADLAEGLALTAGLSHLLQVVRGILSGRNGNTETGDAPDCASVSDTR